MSEERQQILQMLQAGAITADQAMDLLEALESSEPPQLEEPDSQDTAAPEPDYGPALEGDVIHPQEPPPNMDRFRRFWQIPFFICLGFLMISGLWLRSIYQASEGAISLGFVCLWSVFIFAFLLTVLAFMSRQVAWVHVRVREKAGTRIAISLPLPLGLAKWGVQFAQGFVDDETKVTLHMASDFITAAQESMKEPGSEPLMIHVDDDDGDRVQVYIG